MKNLKKNFDNLKRRFKISKELQLAKEALQYYAHPDHYEERQTFSGLRPPGVLSDNGDRARKTLIELGEKPSWPEIPNGDD